MTTKRPFYVPISDVAGSFIRDQRAAADSADPDSIFASGQAAQDI